MKMTLKLNVLFLHVSLVLIFLILTGCRPKQNPKPRAYFRIDFPEKQYQKWNKNFPYSFQKASVADVVKDQSKNAGKYWMNIQYPENNATIHLSYKRGDVEEFLEDSRKMAYKHSLKADAIEEQMYLNREKQVFALVYRIKGNTASALQFVATDSVRHFLRGALYFKERPNRDSLAPVIQYIEKDIVQLIETLQWKN